MTHWWRDPDWVSAADLISDPSSARLAMAAAANDMDAPSGLSDGVEAVARAAERPEVVYAFHAAGIDSDYPEWAADALEAYERTATALIARGLPDPVAAGRAALVFGSAAVDPRFLEVAGNLSVPHAYVVAAADESLARALSAYVGTVGKADEVWDESEVNRTPDGRFAPEGVQVRNVGGRAMAISVATDEAKAVADAPPARAVQDDAAQLEAAAAANRAKADRAARKAKKLAKLNRLSSLEESARKRADAEARSEARIVTRGSAEASSGARLVSAARKDKSLGAKKAQRDEQARRRQQAYDLYTQFQRQASNAGGGQIDWDQRAEDLGRSASLLSNEGEDVSLAYTSDAELRYEGAGSGGSLTASIDSPILVTSSPTHDTVVNADDYVSDFFSGLATLTREIVDEPKSVRDSAFQRYTETVRDKHNHDVRSADRTRRPLVMLSADMSDENGRRLLVRNVLVDMESLLDAMADIALSEDVRRATVGDGFVLDDNGSLIGVEEVHLDYLNKTAVVEKADEAWDESEVNRTPDGRFAPETSTIDVGGRAFAVGSATDTARRPKRLEPVAARSDTDAAQLAYAARQARKRKKLVKLSQLQQARGESESKQAGATKAEAPTASRTQASGRAESQARMVVAARKDRSLEQARSSISELMAEVDARKAEARVQADAAAVMHALEVIERVEAGINEAEALLAENRALDIDWKSISNAVGILDDIARKNDFVNTVAFAQKRLDARRAIVKYVRAAHAVAEANLARDTAKAEADQRATGRGEINSITVMSYPYWKAGVDEKGHDWDNDTPVQLGMSLGVSYLREVGGTGREIVIPARSEAEADEWDQGLRFVHTGAHREDADNDWALDPDDDAAHYAYPDVISLLDRSRSGAPHRAGRVTVGGSGTLVDPWSLEEFVVDDSDQSGYLHLAKGMSEAPQSP